jgi:phytanoyl-CoA hydroxylase
VTPNDAFNLTSDGFTVVKGVHAPELVIELRLLFESVIRYAELDLEDPFARYYLRHRPDQGALYDVVQRHPAAMELARAPAVLDAMASVLGQDIFMYENSVVYKPPGKRNAVPYHQDFISRPQESRKLIAWTALEPVTRATGAMKMFPGSHKLGFLPWHRVKGETHHDRIVPESLPKGEPIQLELDPGDVLIFNQLLVHGSDEVNTDRLRIAMRVSYQAFEDTIAVPRGAPMVMRGGDPASLAANYQRTRSSLPLEPFWKRAVHYVGRRLASV